MNISEIKNFLKEKNLSALKRLGQNFLINENLIENLVKIIQKNPEPYIEIGPGLGALTKHFISRKNKILLIEKDKKLAIYWRELGFSTLQQDALKLDWMKLPKKFTLFGNLPYQIVGSLILTSSLYRKQIFTLIFMMQKEVAQRVQACPKSKNYGLLSVISQVFWDISLIAEVPKSYFYPQPKVDGRVLAFTPKTEDLREASAFLKFVKKCFSFKRKMLFKQLGDFQAEEAKKILKQLGISENCRAEELSTDQFIELYKSSINYRLEN